MLINQKAGHGSYIWNYRSFINFFRVFCCFGGLDAWKELTKVCFIRMSSMASINYCKLWISKVSPNINRPNKVQNMTCFFNTISEWNSQIQITVGYIGKISSNWKVCVKAWTLTPPAMDRKSLWKMEIGQILISKVKGRMTWDRGFLASSSSIACSQRTLYWNKNFVDIFRGKNCNFEITHSFFLFLACSHSFRTLYWKGFCLDIKVAWFKNSFIKFGSNLRIVTWHLFLKYEQKCYIFWY